MATVEDIKNRYTYHPPSNDAVADLHEDVRSMCQGVANFFEADLPEGREKSLAHTKLEEAMFWANAAIARNQ